MRSGTTFALAREHLLLEEGVMTAKISDNTSRSIFTVINKSEGKDRSEG